MLQNLQFFIKKTYGMKLPKIIKFVSKESSYIDPANISEMREYVAHIRHNKSLQMIAIWSQRENIKSFIELTNNIKNKIWIWYTENIIFKSRLNYSITKDSLGTHLFFKLPGYPYGNQYRSV